MRKSFISSVLLFTLFASMHLWSATAQPIVSYIDCGDGSYGQVYIYDGDGDGKHDTMRITNCEGKTWYVPLSGPSKDLINGSSDFRESLNNSEAVLTSGTLSENSDWTIKIIKNSEAIAEYIAHPQSENRVIDIIPLIGVLEKNSMKASSNKVKIYPNPSSEILNISSDEKILSLMIFDIDGNIVLKKEVNDYIINIQTDLMCNGYYTLQILKNNGVEVLMFVVNK